MRWSKRSSLKWDKQHLDNTQRVLQVWATRDPGAAKTEAEGFRQAMADADWDTVERHGGFDAAVRKVLQSEQETGSIDDRGMIDDFRLWGSSRCRQMGRHLSDGGVAV